MYPDWPCDWQAGVIIKFCKWCIKSAIGRVLCKFVDVSVSKLPSKYLRCLEDCSA
nr:MAG TPA_asm: hypothetical protein [Caudoviricetes sp.]